MIQDEDNYRALADASLDALRTDKAAETLPIKMRWLGEVETAVSAQHFLTYRDERTSAADGTYWIPRIPGDGSVLALSDRIAGVARDGRPKGSLSITVRRTDGRSVTAEATDPIGSPEKPLSDAQFEAKLRDCARNAVRPQSDASVDAVLAAIGRLETLADARELLTPFAE